MSRFYEKHKSVMDKIDGLFLGNTVLERGLVVSPVIVAATTLQNSVILAIAYAVITFLTVFCTSFIPKRLPYTIRVIADHNSYLTQGMAKLFIPSGGADSPRPIQLRQAKDGKWYLWEQFLLTDIRQPESANPWA